LLQIATSPDKSGRYRLLQIVVILLQSGATCSNLRLSATKNEIQVVVDLVG